MKILGGATVILCVGTMCSPVRAEAGAGVLLSSQNQMPACATPGRLTSFLQYRNPSLRSKFTDIAVHYMKHGEELNIRWDFAFFQMLLETNALKFTGDVSSSQNNFAGLGATGGGVKGESFTNVSEGVRAHLEHLLIYAGVRVDNPVAERTRKVQSWNILEGWRRSISGPITFGHIGKKWAPSDRSYARNIKAVANRFYESFCNREDPNPGLVAQARGSSSAGQTAQVAQASSLPQANTSASPLQARASLGAATVYRRTQKTSASASQQKIESPAQAATTAASKNSFPANVTSNNQSYQIINNSDNPSNLNTASTGAKKNASQQVTAKLPDRTASSQKEQQIAFAGSLADKFASQQTNTTTTPQNDAGKAVNKDTKSVANTQPGSKKCRVWTASYGGQKAIIIRSSDEAHTNYTVLDVNPDREQQETKAYIAAYAQGGKKIAEFKSQTLALDEAFKLCPNG